MSLKVLMLEDSETDAEIVQRLLKADLGNCIFHLAMTGEAFVSALHDFAPHVVLADNSLSQFDAAHALRIVRAAQPHLPFILVTGTVSEEFAAGIIRSGADDYVLKDRLTRLPSAIQSAVRKQETELEKERALEQMKSWNERFQMLTRATRDAVWDWDLAGNEVWWSDNFFQLLGYAPQTAAPPASVWGDRIHPDDKDRVLTRLSEIRESRISSWEDEFRLLLPDGTYGQVLERTYIIRDRQGSAVRALGVLVDITEQVRLRERVEEERLTEKLQRQKAVTRAMMQSQERERNILGRELHDNINQMLASVSLRLGFYLEEPEGNLEIIQFCRETLLEAIREARNLSHQMVIPRFSERKLREELQLLVENFNLSSEVRLELRNLNEDEIPVQIKEALYRIAQEQLSNIIKHSQASNVVLQVKNDGNSTTMTIQDNGIGFEPEQKRKGIGISNIFNRVDSYNGKAVLTSRPGNGCTLTVTMPLQETR